MIDQRIPTASAKKIAPWLDAIWDGINLAEFPNAVLLHGQSGIGKFEFSIELAKAFMEAGAPAGLFNVVHGALGVKGYEFRVRGN